MKSIQNKGINLTAEDLKNRIADRKERYTKQQARREKLEQTMENTRNDIEQLEYTLAQMERAAKRSRNAAVQPSRFVPRERIASFFARVSRFFDHLQHRLHRSLNYTWFCLVLCSRYTFQSRPEKRRTLLSYTGHGAGVLQEGEGDVTSDFALMVEAALGISAELLVNRQARYNMAVSLKKNR
ncbi:hypothetical protein NIB75_14835 [Bacteroides uniformis]|nr:hypothetical protein [Bacteroides uniformis]